MSSHPLLGAAKAPGWWPAGWRLSTRMVLVSVLLLLVLQVASFAALRAGIQGNARQQLGEQLEVGSRIWARLVEQRGAKLSQAAMLLAADYGFRSAVGSDDRETIVSALENHGARIDATLAAWLDTGLQVQAVAHGSSAAWRDALQSLGPLLQQDGNAVALVGQRPVQFVMVPMRAPVLSGWVVMGFELDGSLLADLHAVSGLHASLVVQARGAAPLIVRSSLPAVSPARALAVGLDPDSGQAQTAAIDDGSWAGVTQSAEWVQRSVPMVSGAAGSVTLQLAGPLAHAIEAYQEVQLYLAALSGLGLLLFGLGNAWLAGRVAQPLRELAQASERLGQGVYDVPLQQTARGDELGELARAFEHMRVNIGTHQRQVHQLAYWDPLTGLPNRLQFKRAVQSLLERATVPDRQTGVQALRSLAVVMLDLDRFKHVNDVLGYATGDLLLQGVAQRLRKVVREGDLVARLGGDEFALLLPGADLATALEAAARVAAELETPLSLADQTVDLSAALGIACWPQHADAVDLLMSRAEVAMYAAKMRTEGVICYDARLDNSSAQTLSLLSELRRAVDDDELRLFLQPKVAVASGALCGAEALVRWQHPQRGLVPPMAFIPFAEQTGFVRQLTLWIFEKLVSQMAELHQMGVERVSVNLSTRDLMDLELPQKLSATLDTYGASAASFCLEITESAIMDDPDRAEATITRLAERGFKLSIDDFGTGYSSLAYLKRLPVNELKIDKSFVMGMAAEEGDIKIVRSTIDLAHNLGLTVVAEGVENVAAMHQLAQMGCDEAQGYHLSKPLPVNEFGTWAAKWRGQVKRPVEPAQREPADAQAARQPQPPPVVAASGA